MEFVEERNFHELNNAPAGLIGLKNDSNQTLSIILKNQWIFTYYEIESFYFPIFVGKLFIGDKEKEITCLVRNGSSLENFKIRQEQSTNQFKLFDSKDQVMESFSIIVPHTRQTDLYDWLENFSIKSCNTKMNDLLNKLLDNKDKPSIECIKDIPPKDVAKSVKDGETIKIQISYEYYTENKEKSDIYFLFPIAHELGHVFKNNFSSLHDQESESEIDQFAIEYLMLKPLPSINLQAINGIFCNFISEPRCNKVETFITKKQNSSTFVQQVGFQGNQNDLDLILNNYKTGVWLDRDSTKKKIRYVLLKQNEYYAITDTNEVWSLSKSNGKFKLGESQSNIKCNIQNFLELGIRISFNEKYSILIRDFLKPKPVFNKEQIYLVKFY